MYKNELNADTIIKWYADVLPDLVTAVINYVGIDIDKIYTVYYIPKSHIIDDHLSANASMVIRSGTKDRHIEQIPAYMHGRLIGIYIMSYKGVQDEHGY